VLGEGLRSRVVLDEGRQRRDAADLADQLVSSGAWDLEGADDLARGVIGGTGHGDADAEHVLLVVEPLGESGDDGDDIARRRRVAKRDVLVGEDRTPGVDQSAPRPAAA
jgi:hypothetical protein